jgi:hypothetical protein
MLLVLGYNFIPTNILPINLVSILHYYDFFHPFTDGGWKKIMFNFWS